MLKRNNGLPSVIQLSHTKGLIMPEQQVSNFQDTIKKEISDYQSFWCSVDEEKINMALQGRDNPVEKLSLDQDQDQEQALDDELDNLKLLLNFLTVMSCEFWDSQFFISKNIDADTTSLLKKKNQELQELSVSIANEIAAVNSAINKIANDKVAALPIYYPSHFCLNLIIKHSTDLSQLKPFLLVAKTYPDKIIPAYSGRIIPAKKTALPISNTFFPQSTQKVSSTLLPSLRLFRTQLLLSLAVAAYASIVIGIFTLNPFVGLASGILMGATSLASFRLGIGLAKCGLFNKDSSFEASQMVDDLVQEARNMNFLVTGR